MALVCRVCKRANPAEALYCYHDGAALDGHGPSHGPVAIGAQPFHNPFIFPSGKSCRNFDELALACELLWNEAKELLQQGYLEGFLGSLGRADLARAARLAAQSPDQDRGLNDFLSKLPASTREPPKLLVQPMEINLGQLSRSGDQHLILDLANQGMGLLTGSISCADTSDWLGLGDSAGVTRKVFQFRHELRLPVSVIGKCLRAGNKPLEGRLNLETNGGSATVLIRADVPVQPYPDGVLAGASSPRELAAKAKAQPREAAILFEKGAVDAWYQKNGWTYPVQGPAASGLGAIQQFFEALGLVKPPVVEISTQSVLLAGAPGGSLAEEITVQTVEKRPVFAYATTATPWIQVGKPVLKGQIARIPLRVPSIPAMPGERLQGKVQVTANGNQRFMVDVTLDVAGQRVARSAAEVIPVLDLESSGPVLPRVSAGNGSAAVPILGLADLAQEPVLAPAPVPVMPSLADLYGTSAPVARVVPLPDNGPAPDAMPFGAPVLEAVPLDDETAVEVVPVEPTRRHANVTSTVPTVEPVNDEEETRTPLWMHLIPVAFLGLCLLVTVGRDLIVMARSPVGVGGLGPDGPLDPNPRIHLGFHDTDLQVTLGSGGVKPQGQEAGKTSPATWEPSMRFGLVMLNQPDPLKPGKLKRLTFEELGLTNNTCVKLDGNEWLFGERPFRRQDGLPTGNWPGRWLERDAQLPATANSIEGRRSTWVYDQQNVEITQTVEIVRGTQSALLDTCLVRYKLTNKDRFPHRVGLRFLLDTFIGSNDGVPFLIPGGRQLCSTSQDFPMAQQVPDFIQACEKEDLANPGTIAQIGLRLGGGLESPNRVTLGAWPNPLLRKPGPWGRGDERCMQEKTLWEVPLFSIHSLPTADSAVTIYWQEKDLPSGQSRDVGFTYGLGTVSAGEGAGKLALTVGGSFVPRGEFTVTAYVSNPAPGQTVTLALPDGFDRIEGELTQTVPPLPPDGSSRHSPVTWKVRGPRQQGKYNLKVTSSTGVSQTQQVKIEPKGIFGE